MGRAVKQQQRKSADRARVHTLLRVFPGDYHRVARELGRDKRFVERWAKRADTGNKAGGGRKKLLGHRAVQRAVELASEGVKEFGAGAVAKRLCRDGYTSRTVSRQTVCRALKRRGIKVLATHRRPPLSEKHKAARVDWAKQNSNQDFDRVVAIDSSIQRAPWQHDSNHRRWQAASQERRSVEVHKHPNQLHVYGAVCSKGASDLVEVTGTTGLKPFKDKTVRGVTAEEYIQVIDNLIVPFGNACYPGESWTVLEDGASVHKAKVVVRHWATQHPHVHVLRTAPCSPDLNPIENCWGMLQSSRAGLPMNTMLQLRTSVHMDWQKLGQNQELMQRLFAGMPGRLQKTIDLQGGHIERNIYT